MQNCIGENCNPFIKMRFIIENILFFSRNEHLNKYEIENILQTKPKKSAREFQGRQKFQVTCPAGQVVSNVNVEPCLDTHINAYLALEEFTMSWQTGKLL